MKTLTLLLVLTYATTSLAVGRGGRSKTPESAKRPGLSQVKDASTSLSALARTIFGARIGNDYSLKVPEGLKTNELATYQGTISSLQKALDGKKGDFSKDNTKANEVAQLFITLNKAFSARNTVKEFLNNGKESSEAGAPKLSKENSELVKEFLETYDNLIRVLEARVNETNDAPFSNETFMRVLEVLEQMPATGMTIGHLVKAETTITALLPKNYRMRDIARCR